MHLTRRAQVCERPVMTFVYRYYDQAELDRQLNARATVPDITPILARYASESARMRACLPCRLSISYGASEPERLDIFPVATRRPAPIQRPWRTAARSASCQCQAASLRYRVRARRAGKPARACGHRNHGARMNARLLRCVSPLLAQCKFSKEFGDLQPGMWQTRHTPGQC